MHREEPCRQREQTAQGAQGTSHQLEKKREARVAGRGPGGRGEDSKGAGSAGHGENSSEMLLRKDRHHLTSIFKAFACSGLRTPRGGPGRTHEPPGPCSPCDA